MADDDKTAEASKRAEHATPESASSEPAQVIGRPSEWTASDGRGPLERAREGEEGRGESGVSDRPEPLAAAEAEKSASVEAPAATAAIPTDPSPSTSASEPSDRKQGRSLWPIAAAIFLGAVIGAGSAYIDGLYLQGGSTGGPEVANLSARVDALEKRPDPQAAISEIRSSVTALANKVAVLQKGESGDREGAAPASTPVTTSPPKASEGAGAPQSTVDLGPLSQKVAALQSELDSLKNRGSDTQALQEKIAAIEGVLAGLKTSTAAAQAGVTTMEGQQKALAGRVTMPALAVVAESLVQQIELGQPYGAQVDALASLGVDPAKVAVLRENADKGVASAKTLAAKFEPLSESVASTARKPEANAGIMERLKSGAFSLVSIRRADDPSGDDLPSRVARIKASLAHDDVPGALSTWEALPADAKAKSAAWGALAKASADAMTAARALQHDAIVAMGTKKS